MHNAKYELFRGEATVNYIFQNLDCRDWGAVCRWNNAGSA